MEERSIHQYVLDQLQIHKGHWSVVSRGTGIPKRTIEKVARQETRDPGVSIVQRLYDYFKSSSKRSTNTGLRI